MIRQSVQSSHTNLARGSTCKSGERMSNEALLQQMKDDNEALLQQMKEDKESFLQQTKELAGALREANDENIELRGALSKNTDPFTMVSFSVVTIIHESHQGGIKVYPVPNTLIGKAKVAAILRQAANNILKTTLEE